MSPADLTTTQRKVLAFIREHRRENQMLPTRAEISSHFNWSSPNAAQCHLVALERHGAIRLTGTPRGIFDLETA